MGRDGTGCLESRWGPCETQWCPGLELLHRWEADVIRIAGDGTSRWGDDSSALLPCPFFLLYLFMSPYPFWCCAFSLKYPSTLGLLGLPPCKILHNLVTYHLCVGFPGVLFRSSLLHKYLRGCQHVSKCFNSLLTWSSSEGGVLSPACQLFKLLDQVEVKSETFLRPAQYCSSSHSMAACLSLHPLVFRIPFPHSLSCPHLLILCQVKPLLWALFRSQHQISLSLFLPQPSPLWLSSYWLLLWCWLSMYM